MQNSKQDARAFEWLKQYDTQTSFKRKSARKGGKYNALNSLTFPSSVIAHKRIRCRWATVINRSRRWGKTLLFAVISIKGPRRRSLIIDELSSRARRQRLIRNVQISQNGRHSRYARIIPLKISKKRVCHLPHFFLISLVNGWKSSRD